ncbi:hypothetical protein [Serratia sp. CY74737]|uniref:hypothetical protein n=1 Tax=Serratia sp. CY74737 TaxID=3383677 RepID=UPI003FA0868E
MMVTHKIVQQEAEELKDILKAGGIQIPDFWSCLWPGLLLVAWLILCPLFSFFISGQPVSELLAATGGSAFLGMLLSFGFINTRSLYLSLPREFRATSEVLSLIRKKIRAYAATFFVLILIFSLSAAYSDVGSMAYLFPLVLCTVMMGFIFNMDIGRYRLSAFTSVMELLKSRKQGGE